MKSLFQATVVAAVFGLAAACASGGGGSTGTGTRSGCRPEPRDTIFRSSGVVFRDCAVDRPARALASNPKPNFTPNTNGGPTCYTAEFEFVVDQHGRPEPETIQPRRSTDPAFSTSIAETIPSLVFEPAMKQGEPVKQIVNYKQSISIVKVVVPAGAPMRPPTPRPTAC